MVSLQNGNFILVNEEKNQNSFNDNKNKQNNKVEMPRNTQGGIHGCLIVGFGFLLIIFGIILLVLGAEYDNVFLIALGSLIGTLIAGYFILYPFIRLFFGGKDSIAVAIATKVVEGIIVHEIKKSKKRNEMSSK